MYEVAPTHYRGHLVHLRDDRPGCWAFVPGLRLTKVEADSWPELQKKMDDTLGVAQ